MGRYMTELGMTPAARSRITLPMLPKPDPVEIVYRLVSPEDHAFL